LALDTYYRLNNWDSEGVPRREKLADLGLEWVSEQLPANA